MVIFTDSGDYLQFITMTTRGPRFFSVVLLKNSRKLLVVDEKWVQTQLNAHDVNIGAKRSLQRTIFFSPVSQNQNFNLPIQSDFDENSDACHNGYFLKSFGKIFMKILSS